MSYDIKRARGRTAVFSGKRQSNQIPRLEELCIQQLLNHVDRIENVGDVPYYVLKPLLSRISVSELKRIESFNPKFLEEDQAWKRHCNEKFTNRQPKPGQSWRDLYNDCCYERDKRLQKITKKIKKAEPTETRQAKIVQLPTDKTKATKVRKEVPGTSSAGKKSGPLMQKTIQLFKNRFKR